MMETQHPDQVQVLESLAQNLIGDASVRKVYGEPIVTQGKTIIPVARVAFGFGGGYGEKNKRASQRKDAPGASPNEEASGKDGGGGMGGGMMARPIGVIEVTPEHTRFIPLSVTRYVALGAVIGLVISRLWRRR